MAPTTNRKLQTDIDRCLKKVIVNLSAAPESSAAANMQERDGCMLVLIGDRWKSRVRRAVAQGASRRGAAEPPASRFIAASFWRCAMITEATSPFSDRAAPTAPSIWPRQHSVDCLGRGIRCPHRPAMQVAKAVKRDDTQYSTPQYSHQTNKVQTRWCFVS